MIKPSFTLEAASSIKRCFSCSACEITSTTASRRAVTGYGLGKGSRTLVLPLPQSIVLCASVSFRGWVEVCDESSLIFRVCVSTPFPVCAATVDTIKSKNARTTVNLFISLQLAWIRQNLDEIRDPKVCQRQQLSQSFDVVIIPLDRLPQTIFQAYGRRPSGLFTYLVRG